MVFSILGISFMLIVIFGSETRRDITPSAIIGGALLISSAICLLAGNIAKE